MYIIEPNLNYSNRYIRDNITKWGVGPNQCTHIITRNGETLYLYLDKAMGPPFTSQANNIPGIDLPYQPDGTYNWIYFLDDSGNQQIHVCQVVSPTELGTKHIDILIRSEKCIKTLFLCGELQKLDGTYRLNFYSGSTSMSNLPDQETIGNNFIPIFRQLVDLPIQHKVEFKNHPFEQTSVASHFEVLKQYESVGYQLMFFQSYLDCQKYRRHLIRLKSMHKTLTMLNMRLDSLLSKKDLDKIRSVQTQITAIRDQINNVPKPKAIGTDVIFDL